MSQKILLSQLLRRFAFCLCQPRAFVVRKRKLYHFDFRKVLPDNNLPIYIEYTKRCDPEQYQSIALKRWLVPYGYNIDSMRNDFVESDGMEG